jgi:hypothetical protein
MDFLVMIVVFASQPIFVITNPPIPLSDNARIGMGLIVSLTIKLATVTMKGSSLVVSMVSRSTPAQIRNYISCSLLRGLATQPTVVLPCVSLLLIFSLFDFPSAGRSPLPPRDWRRPNQDLDLAAVY